VKRIPTASRWFCGMASVGSQAERPYGAAHVLTGVTFGLPAHRSCDRKILGWTQIKGQPQSLGLNAEALRSRYGTLRLPGR
jgi:hypothetical protein